MNRRLLFEALNEHKRKLQVFSEEGTYTIEVWEATKSQGHHYFSTAPQGLHVRHLDLSLKKVRWYLDRRALTNITIGTDWYTDTIKEIP